MSIFGLLYASALLQRDISTSVFYINVNLLMGKTRFIYRALLSLVFIFSYLWWFYLFQRYILCILQVIFSNVSYDASTAESSLFVGSNVPGFCWPSFTHELPLTQQWIVLNCNVMELRPHEPAEFWQFMNIGPTNKNDSEVY